MSSSSSNSSTAAADRPQPPIDHRTTSQLLKQATVSFSALFPTFFFLSLLLLSFRIFLQNGTLLITTFIDRDPSLKSLLTRPDIAGQNRRYNSSIPGHRFSTARHHHHPHRHHHRLPFLHLTRVGTLDDDFFSGDEYDDRSIFGNYRKEQVNGSFLALSSSDSKLGLSNFVVDNGIRFSEVVRTGVSFKIEGLVNVHAEVNDEKNSTFEDSEGKRENVDEGIVDLRFFIDGLELGPRDAAALIFLVGVFFAALGWVIVGFVVTYSWVLGIVFLSVVNELLGRYSSFAETVWSGSRLGLKRLPGFIYTRWVVYVFTHILGLWFFGEIEDHNSFLKVFLRLDLMPFSVNSPWEISGFGFVWFFVDTLIVFMLALDSWIMIVDTTRSGMGIIKQGCNLLLTMFRQAVQLKFLEVILNGSVRWVVNRFCGQSIAIILQSLIEVYFMVAWLLFYFSARCRDARLRGRRFGRRELEGLSEGLR